MKMAEIADELLLEVLKACAQSAPEPLYPAAFAAYSGLERKLLVEGKELPPMPPPPSKPDDGVQHVIKPDLQPGRAKGGERPATA